MLRQDFGRLRFILSHGRVSVAYLGSELESQELLGSANTIPSGSDAPAMSPRRYFFQTGHAVQGEFLRYWEAHGGAAVFGLPITDLELDRNSDGSGRYYATQWFQNARMEWHPEIHNPRFKVLLGFLGQESLYTRGWLPIPAGLSNFYR